MFRLLQISPIRPIPRPRSSVPRPLAALHLLAALLLLAPVPVYAQGGSLDELSAGDDALLRQIEKAARLEEEAERRAAESEAARKAEVERKRREVSERNAALEREREERLQAALQNEMAMQDEMLSRRERNEAADRRDLLGAHKVEDLEGAFDSKRSAPRAAPEAPEIRDLPRAIFNEKSIRIAAGTPGFDNKRKLKAVRLSLDADSDGKPEVVRFITRKGDTPLRHEEDRNYDGRMDAYLTFVKGRLVARELDSNYDGRNDIFERYKGGRQTERSLDRDHDDVVDAFYEYDGRYLARERHDADNNGTVDLTIDYKKGRRDKAQEDTDRDGRLDTWTRYGVVDGRETVTHIEVDKNGRGFADTFEVFEPLEGRVVISRREEDMDGDGEIDLVSIYRRGKLVRREILKPEVVPL
ncbi:MAG: hypothetical protein QF570_01235 [Myxococcota bacterium]|jgi:hypothetical protein|nr:hypothetical protein [Myxococcota bacterium]